MAPVDVRVVTVDLEADSVDLVAVGDEVAVDLPDGSTVTGTVSEIGTVAEACDRRVREPVRPDGGGDDLAGAARRRCELRAGAGRGHAITSESRENVLAVPVNALVALLEGGYAVERVADDGTSTLVGVELGIFQDGWVEVRTDGLDEGDTVAVPS